MYKLCVAIALSQGAYIYITYTAIYPCFLLFFQELIQPLLEIIRTCLSSKDFTALGERAQGIFKNKLCSIKEVYLVDFVNSD